MRRERLAELGVPEVPDELAAAYALGGEFGLWSLLRTAHAGTYLCPASACAAGHGPLACGLCQGTRLVVVRVCDGAGFGAVFDFTAAREELFRFEQDVEKRACDARKDGGHLG